MAGPGEPDRREFAARVWNALDDLVERDPEEYKKFIDQELKEGAEALQPPQPVFCLRCEAKLRGSKRILFVNICKWSRLPRPETDHDPVPVKGGTLRHVVKKGKRTPSLLFDLAFNPHVTDECGADPLLYEMLVSLTMEFVADTTGIEVDSSKCEKLTRSHKGPVKDIRHSLDESLNQLLPPECRIDVGDTILDALHRRDNCKVRPGDDVLPPLRLPGDSQPNPKKPLIQELPGAVGESDNEAIQRRVRFPEHTMDVRDGEVIVCINLPGVDSVADIDLEISKDDFRLEVTGRFFLVTEFPSVVDDHLVKATFNKTTSRLEFKVPVA